MYPSIDFENLPRYPNKVNVKWSENYPKYKGDRSLVVTHVVKFLKYIWVVKVVHEDILIKLLYVLVL
jgi:hypothetical protein